MRTLWVLLIASLLVPGSAGAQNLLRSPDFEDAGDIADWPDPFPDPNTSITWAPPPMDVDGSASSGSLRVETGISNGAADGPRQCVAASPGVLYRAEGWVFTPTLTPQPFPLIGIRHYGTADCTGPSIAFDSQFPASDLDLWKPIQFSVTTPPGTASMGFRLLSGNTTDPTPVAVFFDALFLPEPSGAEGVALLCLLSVGAASSRRFFVTGGSRPSFPCIALPAGDSKA